VRAAAAAALLFCAAGARADVFSPGPLAKAHESLEGLQNCTQCHVKGGQLSEAHCLECHKEIKQRVEEKKGLHGRLAPAERTCNTCHHEHQGRSFDIVDWGAGSGAQGAGASKKASFDHQRTGFALGGKHAKTDCEKCHTDALVRDPAIKAWRSRYPGAKTFLGLPTGCADCHFDEHRDQLGNSCKDCHNERSWKPAPGFRHSRSEYPLEGKHAQVKCVKCHALAHDVETHADAPLPPRSNAFARYKPVAHASCTDCHNDPHQNRFGPDCASCHALTGWKDLRGVGGARAFHEKSRYPLRGAHLEVACKKCHGPYPGVRAKFKNMRFANCTDCHVDAHVGQVGSPPAACDGCHTLQSFAPAKYDPTLHRRYPLQGGHAATACSACHRQEQALLARAANIVEFVKKRGRTDRISLALFKVESKRCDNCHADPHARQFAARVRQHGCADCHQTASFQQVRFDHQRESTYPLTGGHLKAPCAGCHLPDASGVVRYKPVATACASCHADPHAGQFAPGPRPQDCTACHGTAAWKTLSFVHKAPFTAFLLSGKHEAVECGGCHREIKVGNGAPVRQYRGLPTDCAGCHVDVHRGAFKGFVQ
jgi:hypothetical protein